MEDQYEGNPTMEEVLNPDQHEHPLVLSSSLEDFICSGCQEMGSKIGYKCKDPDSSSCNFTLHKDCVLLSDTDTDAGHVAASSSLHPAAINSSLSSAVKYLATATGISALITGGLAEADVGGESGGDSGDGVDKR